MKRVIIIGAGISGLTAAYRLHQRAAAQQSPLDIQLLEASLHAGGSLRTTTREGFQLEGGPDCFLSVKTRGLELCRELGLGDQIIGTNPELRRSFIVRNGRLHPIPEGFYLLAPSQLRPFLLSPLLSWTGKWRVLMEALIPARRPLTLNPSPSRGEGRGEGDESLASFVRRR